MLDNELIKKATLDLWNFHKEWLEAKTDEEKNKLIDIAKVINARYAHATEIMDSFTNKEISRLIDYFANTGLPMLNREETLELIKKLQEKHDRQP